MYQNLKLVFLLCLIVSCSSIEKYSGINEEKEVSEQITAAKNNDLKYLQTAIGDEEDLSAKSYLII